MIGKLDDRELVIRHSMSYDPITHKTTFITRTISPEEFNRIMHMYQQYLATFKDPETAPCSPYNHLMLQLEMQQGKK